MEDDWPRNYLVGGVFNHRPRPWSAARCSSTGKVVDEGGLPVAIHLVVPVLRADCIRVGDHIRFLIQPSTWFLRRLIHYLLRSVLVPVVGLGCFRVWDLLSLILGRIVFKFEKDLLDIGKI